MNHIKLVLASLKELSGRELGVQFDWVHILMVGLFILWVTSQALKDHTMSEQHIHRKVIEELWLKQEEGGVLKGKLKEVSGGSTTFVNSKKNLYSNFIGKVYGDGKPKGRMDYLFQGPCSLSVQVFTNFAHRGLLHQERMLLGMKSILKR